MRNTRNADYSNETNSLFEFLKQVRAELCQAQARKLC